jgi:hypothetical protein
MAIDYKNSLGRYRRYLSNLQNQPLWNASFWVSLTIVLVIIMILFFLRPTLVIISGLLGKVREQKALLVRIDEKINLLKEAQTVYSQTSGGQEVLNKVLPEESLWKEMANSLFQIATDSGAIIKRVEVDGVLVQGVKIEEESRVRVPEKQQIKLPVGVEKVDFRLEVDGEYAQIKECLAKIEQSGRMLLISSATINRNKDGSLNLIVSGYATFFKYQKEEL